MGNANLLEVARGAIGERLDYELSKVVDNIADLNTKADAVRKITLTLSLKPDSERQNIKMSTQVKSTLTPTNNIESALYLTESDEGKAFGRNASASTGTNGIRRLGARRAKGYTN